MLRTFSMSAVVEAEVSVLHCGCFNRVSDSDSVGVCGYECLFEHDSPTGSTTPTVWFVVGILLSELLRLRCLSVTCLFILFITICRIGTVVRQGTKCR
jgi:hypothetical protein